jgi:uncharacterized protein YdbL (DUF1318 family)
MRYATRPSPFLLALTFTACVTINIYFPAAAAERAADRIIREVWDVRPAPGASPPPTPPGDNPSQRQEGKATEPYSALRGMLDVVLPPASAEEPNLTISTPAIEKLTNSMRARHAQLEPYYQSGAVGLTNDALITVRDANAIPLDERNVVRQLVAEENADRNALYREIARANGRPEWEDNIRSTFAGRWIANARPGWWYQDGSGAWRQK